MNHKVLYLLCLIVLVLQVVAIALPNWAKTQEVKIKANMGLWQGCATGDYKICKKLPSVHFVDEEDQEKSKRFFMTVRALSILGAICILMAYVCMLALKSSNRNRSKMIIVLLILGGLLTISASIIYSTKFGGKKKWKSDFAYWMHVSAGILALVLSFFFIRESKYDRPSLVRQTNEYNLV